VATTYNNIALVHDKQGKDEMALELYDKSLAIKIKALGEDHPSVADSKYDMAGSLAKQGELARAGVLVRESAAIYSKVHGAEHEKTLDALQKARYCEQGAA